MALTDLEKIDIGELLISCVQRMYRYLSLNIQINGTQQLK
jgi:hypothetical protein